jgi:hypothetical protein
MMTATEGYGKLIADLAAKRSLLRKAQMMGIYGTSATDETRLFGDKFDVIAVTHTTRRRQCQYTFVDGSGLLTPFSSTGRPARSLSRRFRFTC